MTELDSSTATDLHCTAINPALFIVGLLPTPQLRTAALLAALRAEVARRSGKGPSTTPRSASPPNKLRPAAG